MKKQFIEIIKKSGGFTTSATIMTGLRTDLKGFNQLKEQLVSENIIYVTRGRNGGIGLVPSDAPKQQAPVVKPTPKIEVPKVEIPKVESKPVRGGSFQKELSAIGVTVAYEVKKANNKTTFLLFDTWTEGPWNKVQEICQRHGMIADAKAGILWKTANA